MKLRLQLNFFVKEFLMYAVTMAAGASIAYRYSHILPAAVKIEPIDFSWPNVLVLFSAFIFFSFILARFKKIARFSFQFFLVLVTFTGARLFFGAFVNPPMDLALALAAVCLIFLFHDVLTHDIGVILGIAGVSALLGLSITPTTAVFIMAVLGVYDIIAVYKTKHMVNLARGMIESGAVFGFLVPVHWGGFLNLREHAVPGEQFMILGSGDIGLPVVLVSSIVPYSIHAALVVAAFSTAGLFLTHLIFVNQNRRQPMAALPPIATLSIIGYVVSLFLI